ncbi:MAG: hypothetical protein RLZZ427_1162 [Pseudomonadota bacterium]|jgi:pilus assembly protein CpaD
MPKPIIRTKPAAVAILALGLALGGCGAAPANRSLESVHQPVVSHTNYALDLSTGPDGLALAEQRRLTGWLDALALRYGDRVFIDDPLASPATRTAVDAIAERFGILVGTDAPVTPGDVPSGTVRIIVSRASAAVPGCPDWSAKSGTKFTNATAPNFGCATNGNLAAMIADPEHLIHGAEATGSTAIMSSTKAIDSYRQNPPTGTQVLKQESTKSGN